MRKPPNLCRMFSGSLGPTSRSADRFQPLFDSIRDYITLEMDDRCKSCLLHLYQLACSSSSSCIFRHTFFQKILSFFPVSFDSFPSVSTVGFCCVYARLFMVPDDLRQRPGQVFASHGQHFLSGEMITWSSEGANSSLHKISSDFYLRFPEVPSFSDSFGFFQIFLQDLYTPEHLEK